MAEITIEQYDSSLEKEWNEFNSNSRNATFLTDRRFMDYHSDRFRDCSLIARKNGKIIALLPANICSCGILHSHQGLTFGGWILPRKHFDCTDMMAVWDAMTEYCKSRGIKAIDYKPLPYIYASAPSGEDIYALFRHQAAVTECNISACIHLSDNPGFNTLRRRALRKASALDIEIKECRTPEAVAEFHCLLTECLSERHKAAPVHSFAELQMLAARFPANIRFFVIKHNDKAEAGCCLFLSRKVAHCQYIASTPEGRSSDLLTPLFHHLIAMTSAGDFGSEIEFFDFGTSNENNGLVLNEGLYRQKASMGGSGVPYLRYLQTLD